MRYNVYVKKNIIIIDTREPEEYQHSHLEGAINISTTEFMSGQVPKKLQGIEKDQPILLYCRSGQRSNTCSMILEQHGFTNITNGINEHRAAQILERM